MVTKMGENPAVKTEVLAIADREGVAFSFTCHEPVKRELTVDARRHDDPRLYLDDSVEAFFCRPDQSNAIHFIINADGFFADYTWPNSEDSDDISWNSSGLETFNARGDGFWSVPTGRTWSASSTVTAHSGARTSSPPWCRPTPTPTGSRPFSRRSSSSHLKSRHPRLETT